MFKMKILDVKDFNNAADEFHKFAKEVFASTDEKRKVQLLEGMQKLMNQNATSFKRPIDVPVVDSKAKKIKLTASNLPNEMWMKIMSYLKN